MKNIEEFEFLRDGFYLFSFAYRYPDKQTYEIIKENLDFFKNMSDSNLMLPNLEELQTLYVGLFVNNNGFLPVIPYLSCYLDNNYVLYGESYLHIKNIFNELGICLKEEIKEPEDHIYLVLEGCGASIDLYLESFNQKYLDLFQRLFDNLYKILPDFLKAINHYAQDTFYYFVSQGLKEFSKSIVTSKFGGIYEA